MSTEQIQAEQANAEQAKTEKQRLNKQNSATTLCSTRTLAALC